MKGSAMRQLFVQMFHCACVFLRRNAPDLRPLDQRVRESGEW
jgi:hypothetical protein